MINSNIKTTIKLGEDLFIIGGRWNNKRCDNITFICMFHFYFYGYNLQKVTDNSMAFFQIWLLLCMLAGRFK